MLQKAIQYRIKMLTFYLLRMCRVIIGRIALLYAKQTRASAHIFEVLRVLQQSNQDLDNHQVHSNY